MNYYPFHIGDYLSATRHLSWEEDAAYRRLLDTYYTNEKPLPVELRAVCRLVLATTDSQREAVQTVLNEFFELTESGWVNRRADAEIQAMREKQQKQREKANKRWQKPAEEPGNAPAMPRHQETDAVASKTDADAMPPTPTPTPTPTPKEEEKAPRKRSATPQVARPDDVDEQTWDDWLALRKAKKAPVTETVIDQARREAEKADMPLADFLQIWCARGSQGLQAEWIRPNERPQPARQYESFRERDLRLARERFEEAAGRRSTPSNIIDITPSVPFLEIEQ